MSENISLVISIIGILLAIISLILYLLREFRYRIHNEKIRVKKRLFREWYQGVKDLTDRMEFTDIVNKGDYTVYGYKIRKKDGSGFESNSRIKILIERIGKKHYYALSICGYKTERKLMNLAENLRSLPLNKSFNDGSFTVPTDMLPNNQEELRIELLNNVIIDARENGVGKRYLKKNLKKE